MQPIAKTTVALLVFVMAFTCMASDIVLLEPTQRPAEAAGGELDELDEIFFLSRTLDMTAEYYLGSGALADTFAVHFQPLAPCSVYFAEVEWFSDGPFQTFVWEYSDEAQDMYPNGQAPPRGTSPVSPLGDVLFGPFNNSSEGTQTWERLFEENDLPNGGIWLDDGRPFVVGFVKTMDDGLPQPLADDVTTRGSTYTWFGGPWMDGYDHPWGSYSSGGGTLVDVMMRVGVSYAGGNTPPIISNMSMLPNTIDGNKNCTVTAQIVDDNGWTSDIAALFWRKNSLPYQQVMMTGPDADNIFSASFTINAQPGDEISYYIQAADDEGSVNDNQDQGRVFEVVTLDNPDAPILIIDDGAYDPAAIHVSLDGLGWDYATWDVSQNNGMDQSLLIMPDWDQVYMFAWGSQNVPTREYAGNPLAQYAATGGNLFFADQDYFYANGENVEPSFSPGDMAYDVFGLAGGLNDPEVPEDADSSFFGEADDPVTDDFVDVPFMLHFFSMTANNWMDAVEPRPGTASIFIGETYGYVNGVRRESGVGNGKVVYLAFDVSMAITDEYEPEMTDQFDILMGNLHSWFGGANPQPGSLEVWSDIMTVPPNGGSLPYTIHFQNFTGSMFPGVAYWTDVTLPNGFVYGPVFEWPFTALPYMDLTATLTLDVPAFAPSGDYLLNARVGVMPVPVLSDAWPFTKMAGAATAGYAMEAWGHHGTIDVAAEDHEAGVPDAFALTGPYPNPFNPSTTVRVAVPTQAEVDLVITDVLGREVSRLHQGSLAAGEHSFTWQASSMASGVYFLHARSGEWSASRKLLLMK